MKNQPLDTLNKQGDKHKEEEAMAEKTTKLEPSSIEQRKKEFLERIERFREKEKFYNEEKIRLNKLLATLREELNLIEEKRETEEIETSVNKNISPEEKDDEVVPVADTPKEIPEVLTTETEQKITVLEEPLQINIEEVIDKNISSEEKKEIQKEFPGQNIEKVIENEIVKQINNKTIVPIEKIEKDTPLKRIGRRARIYLLAVFVSTTAFNAKTFLKTGGFEEVTSYNNTKVDNLKDWEGIKLHEDEINKLENISIITKAHENSNDKYIVVDKQNGKLHRYQGDNLIKTYNVCLGDSMGDEQTYLKSTYGKILKNLGADEEGVMTYEQQEVSINEATYVKDGERYMKDGYLAFTDWGSGNMKTGAGIYTVSNKGPFLKHFGIFLKNERGLQVATSIHANSHLEPNAPDFRFTNGCIGSSEKDNTELYQLVSLGENIYILPDNPHNRFQIIDGELRFLSDQQNVNRTIRPYETKPIILKAEGANEVGKIILTTIAENKEKLMKLYPTVSNDVYNELAKITYGIFGQESTFGTFGKGRGQLGRAGDMAKTVIGSHPSVGPCQVCIDNVDKKIKDIFNIKSTRDLWNTKTNAIAAMSILLDNYLSTFYNGKTDQYKKLVILRYNAQQEANKIIRGKKELDQLGPKMKGYIKRVLNNSNLAKVYTTNASENYYASNWNYNQPNN